MCAPCKRFDGQWHRGRNNHNLGFGNAAPLYPPERNGKCAEAAMKNSIGKLSQRLICIVSVAICPSFSASGGMGAPCATEARVHAISRFWHRQAMPQTLKNRMVPSPPPMEIESVRLLTPGCANNETTSHEVAVITKSTSAPMTNLLPSAPSPARINTISIAKAASQQPSQMPIHPPHA